MSDLLPEHLALQLLPGECTGIQYTFIFVKIARVWDTLFMSTHVTGEKELISTFPWDLPTTISPSVWWAANATMVQGCFCVAPLGEMTFCFQAQSPSYKIY